MYLSLCGILLCGSRAKLLNGVRFVNKRGQIGTVMGNKRKSINEPYLCARPGLRAENRGLPNRKPRGPGDEALQHGVGRIAVRQTGVFKPVSGH